MLEPSRPDVLAWRDSSAYVRIHDVGAPMIVVDAADRIAELTAPAATLLAKFELPTGCGDALPGALAGELRAALLGEAIMYRPQGETGAVLGFTRYRLGDRHHLLLMREITELQRAMSQRLHQNRLQETGKLVAHIAHDLRAPLASIVYNADVLGKRDLGASQHLVAEIQLAAENLRKTIAGLLAYVRLGPPVRSVFRLRELCDRVGSLLRPVFRAGDHTLTISLDAEDVCISANPLAIEQVFVNLLVNAMEASTRPANIQITSEVVTGLRAGIRSPRGAVLVRVIDDGPGIPVERRDSVFEAFVTSKSNGTGLGLTLARETLANLGGQIMIEDTSVGCTFAIMLPVVRTEETP